MASDSIPEEWRPVEGWPYEVSNLGRVRQALNATPRPGRRPGRVVQNCIGRNGYPVVCLHDGKRQKLALVHRLVALAFLPPPRPDQIDVAHGDGDPSNPRLSNLRWATRKENHADMIAHGRSTRGEKNARSKLSAADVRAIRALAPAAPRYRVLSERFGVSIPTICAIVHRKSWQWLTD